MEAEKSNFKPGGKENILIWFILFIFTYFGFLLYELTGLDWSAGFSFSHFTIIELFLSLVLVALRFLAPIIRSRSINAKNTKTIHSRSVFKKIWYWLVLILPITMAFYTVAK